MSNQAVKLSCLGPGAFLICCPVEAGEITILLNPVTGMQAPEGAVDYILLTYHTPGLWEEAKHQTTLHGSTIVVASEFSNWIRSMEPNLQTMPLTEEQEVELSWGTVVLTVGNYQYRLPNGTSHLGNGFLLKLLGNQIFYAGPTRFDTAIKSVGQLHMPNVAIMPAGPEHMTPEELTRSVMWLGADLLFPFFVELPDHTEQAEAFRDEVFTAIDTYSPAICRILDPGDHYELNRVESTGRQAGPESRY